ncbi:MAG: SBBP repeat-containing protein [Candidatus Thorarchaeota archaeon]
MNKRGLISVLLITSILMMGFYNQTPQVVYEIEVEDKETITDARVPLTSTFYENVGQIANEEILYYSNIDEGMIGFGIGKIFLWVDELQEMSTLILQDSINAIPVGKDPAGFNVNYFLGERGTYSGIKSFKEIEYNNIWDSISLQYQMTVDGVNCDLVLSPNSNLADIDIHCIGPENEYFRFLSSDISFQAGIEDSTLVYSTFLGGSGSERANSMAVDSEGNVYVTGVTSSADFPTVNAYNDTYGQSDDCFVYKLNATGNGLLYATFIGGADEDNGQSIAVDSEGNAYVTGYTESTDFPTVNPIDSSQEGGDAFVLKLSSNGGSLVYSTLLGGSDKDYPRGLALSSTNNVYVTGSTSSTDFPAVSAYDDSFNGGDDYFGGDCFVAKLEDDGSALLFSTYVGGGLIDQGRSIRVDLSGNVYVVGRTNSTDFPTQSAHDSNYNGGSYDVFALRLTADGASISYSTFVGGSSTDMAYSLAIDSSNNIYVTGGTASTDFPVINAYGDTINESGDCFVFKLDESGSTILYSTFVGGSGYDYGWSIEVDSIGNAFVVGGTTSIDFPTVNAYDSSYNDGSRDCILFKLSPDGNSLLYSSYIGGSEGDYGYSVALDENGGVYLCGQTASNNFPVTNAYDSIYSGGAFDSFVMKLTIGEEPVTPIQIPPVIIIAIVGIVAVIVIIVLYQKYRR